MRYFAIFADTGERIMSLVADGMPYTVNDIIKQYPEAIEISEEEQLLYMQGYVRGRNGLPQLQSSEDIEQIKNDKIDIINAMAKSKLMETDHEVVEYLECKNISEEDYNKLKAERNQIRIYRDDLILKIKQATDVTQINKIEFTI